jgi:hypothetical protein
MEATEIAKPPAADANQMVVRVDRTRLKYNAIAISPNAEGRSNAAT